MNDNVTPLKGCTVQIRRNADGVIRNHQETLPWNGPYIWEDGNYGCDCNRSLFFARAANEPEPEEPECGDGAFSVRIVDDNLNELYADESWPARRGTPDNVTPLRPPPLQGPSQPTEPSIAMLMATIEEMDRGIKMMIAVIAEQDKRIRYLELQDRKAQRKNMPVIVNQLGQPVKSN